MGMDSGRSYSESEINEVLLTWQREVAPAIGTDHVTLRRLLVDLGHFERTADGRAYRVGFPPRAMLFDLEVDDIDARATTAAFREEVKRRPRPPQR